ncbi:MAG: hypothetical protein IT542_14115 [Rubellimicrobium sp.]|nr:hypothetical protein [Rubellimicrobium sp.]
MALAVVLAAGPAAAEGVPSGLGVTLYDLVIEPEAGIARFRFVAPDLGSLPFAQVAADLPWLCAQVALPELRANGWEARQVVISIGEREVPMGEMDAGVLQYFEGFAIGQGDCVLEVF